MTVVVAFVVVVAVVAVVAVVVVVVVVVSTNRCKIFALKTTKKETKKEEVAFRLQLSK